jgi:isopentenyl-diphosphate delta-isomerase
MWSLEKGNKTVSQTENRKAEHININLTKDVSAKGIDNGLDKLTFIPSAMPEIDLNDVDTSTEFLGYKLGAPILISSMTGGVAIAKTVNRTLASTAQRYRLPIGLGSGRVLLENPDVIDTFYIRDIAKDVPIFVNLGAVQLNKGIDATQCKQLIEMLDADGIILHLNALQEALQPEGDTCFKGLLQKIKALTSTLRYPVIIKEVGWGISPDIVLSLLDAGVFAVDVAGAGGTSWSEVEKYRQSMPYMQNVASTFSGWGLSTADALWLAKMAAPDSCIIASGGIRNGLDVAKCIALGADLVGLAGNFLRAAANGQEQADQFTLELISELKITMFCTATTSISALKHSPRLVRQGSLLGGVHFHQLQCEVGTGSTVDITEQVEKAVYASGVVNGVAVLSSLPKDAYVEITEEHNGLPSLDGQNRSNGNLITILNGRLSLGPKKKLILKNNSQETSLALSLKVMGQ